LLTNSVVLGCDAKTAQQYGEVKNRLRIAALWVYSRCPTASVSGGTPKTIGSDPDFAWHGG
jgi:hypothetical protein